MEQKNSLITHLLSNVQPFLFPENRANNFINEIPRFTIPHRDTWEVALTEFSCVNTIQTIPKDIKYFMRKDGKLHAYELAKGTYDADNLIQALNKSHTEFEFSKTTIENKKSIIKISITFKQTDLHVYLPPLLADILGLPTTIEKTMTARIPLNLKAFTYNIIVYCDFVEETIVGGQRERVLRIIPFNTDNYLEVFHYEPKQLDYRNVTSDIIDKIHIELRTDFGTLIPMEDGRTYIKLHFRRKMAK